MLAVNQTTFGGKSSVSSGIGKWSTCVFSKLARAQSASKQTRNAIRKIFIWSTSRSNNCTSHRLHYEKEAENLLSGQCKINFPSTRDVYLWRARLVARELCSLRHSKDEKSECIFHESHLKLLEHERKWEMVFHFPREFLCGTYESCEQMAWNLSPTILSHVEVRIIKLKRVAKGVNNLSLPRASSCNVN